MSADIQIWVQPPAVGAAQPPIESLHRGSGYSVREEAISIEPSDTNGATGTITADIFTAEDRIAAKRYVRHELTLTDKDQGSTRGIVRTPSGDLMRTSLTADQRTVLLAVERTAQPFSGTLGDYITYLFSLVGIVDGFVIEGSFASAAVAFPGWRDDVYTQLKRLLIPRGAEITQASGNIVVRPIRGRVTVDKRDMEFSWSMDETSLAQTIEGYWYTATRKDIGLAYPEGGWTDEVQVYQVDANETVVIPLPINASLSSVNQPVALDYVDRNFVGPGSAYAVIGADNKPIPARQWTDAGGSLTVEIGEDTRSLNVRIVGANIEQYAPFRIAATAGPNDNYSSLRITGSGVFLTKSEPYVMQTSATADQTSTEIGATIDSEFITSRDMLIDAMMWTLSRFGGPRQSVNVRTTGIHRIDKSGSYAYATLQDFNLDALSQGFATIADFNAAYAGRTIEDFNEEWVYRATSSFANQAFGNVCGARTFRDGLWYRIRSSEVTPSSVSYTAENDTTVGDFNTWMSEQMELRDLPNTIETFNLLYGEAMTVGQFSAAPLYLEN